MSGHSPTSDPDPEPDRYDGEVIYERVGNTHRITVSLPTDDPEVWARWAETALAVVTGEPVPDVTAPVIRPNPSRPHHP